MDVGEEAGAEGLGGVGPAVAVVDADEGGGRGGEHLRLVLHNPPISPYLINLVSDKFSLLVPIG